MPDRLITDLTAVTTIHDADYGVSVDVSDTTQSASGTTKKWSFSTLLTYLANTFLALSNVDTDGTLTANSDTKIASQKAVKTFVQSLYPVGSIYISTVATNPATLFGFGTWAAFAGGRTLIGVGTSDQAFAAAATGGESTHLLTGAESGEKGHNHTQDAHSHTMSPGTVSNTSGNTDITVGGSGHNYNSPVTNQVQNATATNQAVAASNAANAHNNLPPYIVTYMWNRTA